jgi:hypothetical protein
MLLEPSKRHHRAWSVRKIAVIWVDDTHVVRIILHTNVIFNVAEYNRNKCVVRRAIDGRQIGKQILDVLHQL